MRQLSKAERNAATAWIAGIAKNNGGRLTPELVMLDASDPDSPGHSFFTWDDAAAAYSHRLNEARYLIRSVTVKFSDEVISIKSVAYVRDPDAGEQQGYVATAKLRTNKSKSRDALLYEITRAVGYLKRARQISVDLNLEDEFESLLADVERVRSNL